MPTTTTGKICGLCSSDCSDRPRVKDKTGKYYCKICYNRAMDRKHAAAMAEVSAALRSPGTEVALIETDDDISALNALLESRSAAAPLPETAVRQCANCHAPLSSIAVVCVTCGYNVQTGKLMNETQNAPRLRRSESGRSIWPAVVGIISLGMVRKSPPGGARG